MTEQMIHEKARQVQKTRLTNLILITGILVVANVLGTNLLSETYSTLPVDRNYRSIATILPHANASFKGDGVNISGATGLGNKYFIDGVEVTDGFLERGLVNIVFERDGTSESAQILLSDEDGHRLGIEVAPFADTVRIRHEAR